MERMELTAPEIAKRLAAGERVCLLSANGTQSRVLGVEDPVGGTDVFKVAFRGFITGQDMALDAPPDRKLTVGIYAPAGS